MYNDNLMRVDLEPTVSLSVSSDVSGSVDASVDGHLYTTTEPDFLLLQIKKPYLINKNQIECIVGEWDKDKTQYGVRIFFASGNSVWCGGDSARDALKSLYPYGNGNYAVDKFDAASRR